MRLGTISDKTRTARVCSCAVRASEDVATHGGRGETSARSRPLAVRETQIVIADSKDIALGDLFPSNALTVVLDAVGRAHVDHEVDAVLVLDHRMLPRHVRVLQRQVAGLL